MSNDFFSGCTPANSLETYTFPQFPAPVAFSNLTSAEIANNYYHGNDVVNQNDFKIYTDDDLKCVFSKNDPIELEEAVIYSSRHFKEFDDFQLTLFASTDGVHLLQQHKKATPANNELIIFYNEVQVRIEPFGMEKVQFYNLIC